MNRHTREIQPDHDEADRGRYAKGPSEIPVKGWKDVLWRTFSEVLEDRVTLIAAGVTYYLVLSSFPALGVFVALYGLIADASSIGTQIGFLSRILPPGALQIVQDQLHTLAAPKNSTLGIALITSFLFALWSANNGMKALFEAMNVAYGEHEKRSIVRINLMSLAFTVGGIVVAMALIFAMGIVPAVLSLVYLDRWTETLAGWAPWPVVLLLVAGGTMAIYRYGPSREDAKLRWVTWGAVFSSLSWMATSLAFSFYLQNFADYNATYGTLGALIGFMVWIWLSITILIIGAELNAELEHQTKCDSTTGPPLPMGERGAVMADTVGKSTT